MLSVESTRIAAVLIVVATFSAVAMAVVAHWRRYHYKFPQYFVYLFGILMTRLLWRASVEGCLPVAAGEAAILISNHRSPFDPAFIQLATNRVVHWMVAREYCTHPTFGWFLRTLEVIPVNRGGIDTAATKLAIRYCRGGELIGMLPEGRINVSNKLLMPGRPGAALIALKARVPVIPCYISGPPVGRTIFQTLFVPARTHLVIGEKMDLSDYYGKEKDREVLRELTRLFLRKIAELAGQPDFEPELAGRRWRPED